MDTKIKIELELDSAGVAALRSAISEQTERCLAHADVCLSPPFGLEPAPDAGRFWQEQAELLANLIRKIDDDVGSHTEHALCSRCYREKKPEQEHKCFYVTVTHGMRGYFAVLLWWNSEYGGFWEPWNSGIGSHTTAKKAEVEARMWAKEEGVEFRAMGEKL